MYSFVRSPDLVDHMNNLLCYLCVFRFENQEDELKLQVIVSYTNKKYFFLCKTLQIELALGL